MTMNRDLAKELSNSDYLRCRRSPQVGDFYYLHLSDLHHAMMEFGTDESLDILDYGAGGSPYSFLFPNARYLKADLAGSGKPDFVISEDGTIEVDDEGFDLVISTQVLEHCESAEQYLRECYRLLKKGGRLILTTHGTYQDHGCPYDFRRWTAGGLVKDIESAGFVVQTAKKLTANGRAVAFILLEYSGLLCTAKSGVWRFLARAAYKVIQRLRPYLQNKADTVFPDYRVVDSSATGVDFYIALLVSARKPESDPNAVH